MSRDLEYSARADVAFNAWLEARRDRVLSLVQGAPEAFLVDLARSAFTSGVQEIESLSAELVREHEDFMEAMDDNRALRRELVAITKYGTHANHKYETCAVCMAERALGMPVDERYVRNLPAQLKGKST